MLSKKKLDQIREIENTLQERVKLNKREELLLSLVFADERSGGLIDGKEAWTEETAERLFRSLNLDKASSDFLLLLSHYGRAHRWQYYPDPVRARAEGIQRFYQVKNTTTIPGAAAFAKTVTEAGYPVMLIKGMAMRMYYTPGVPRVMGDADVLVKKSDFSKVVDTLSGVPSIKRGPSALHSVDYQCGYAKIDLHHTLLKNGSGNNSSLWRNAVPIDFKGTQVYVPAPEDMLVLVLYNEYINLEVQEASTRRVRWIYDAGRLVQRADWKQVVERVNAAGIHYEAAFMIRTLMRHLPWVQEYGVNVEDLITRRNANGELEAIPRVESDTLRYYHMTCSQAPGNTKKKFVLRVVRWFHRNPYQYRHEKCLGMKRASHGYPCYFFMTFNEAFQRKVLRPIFGGKHK